MALPAFVASSFFWGPLGWLIGCFTPSIGRKVKSLIAGEAKVIGSKIGTDVKKL